MITERDVGKKRKSYRGKKFVINDNHLVINYDMKVVASTRISGSKSNFSAFIIYCIMVPFTH